VKVALIVAMDQERGIGKNNDLMWHLPNDMKFFKNTTSGHVVIMGRKNWDSIPLRFRPLVNRSNVVLSRNKDFSGEGCTVFHGLEECLSYYKNSETAKVFIIGGGEIYKEAFKLQVVDEMYITHVQANYNADTFFPVFNEDDWKVEEILNHEIDEKHEASFSIKHYTKKH
jgi:dihydrofolate reductase